MLCISQKRKQHRVVRHKVHTSDTSIFHFTRVKWNNMAKMGQVLLNGDNFNAVACNACGSSKKHFTIENYSRVRAASQILLCWNICAIHCKKEFIKSYLIPHTCTAHIHSKQNKTTKTRARRAPRRCVAFLSVAPNRIFASLGWTLSVSRINEHRTKQHGQWEMWRRKRVLVLLFPGIFGDSLPQRKILRRAKSRSLSGNGTIQTSVHSKVRPRCRDISKPHKSLHTQKAFVPLLVVSFCFLQRSLFALRCDKILQNDTGCLQTRTAQRNQRNLWAHATRNTGETQYTSHVHTPIISLSVFRSWVMFMPENV